MDLPVVFFVIAADFANERHQYSETTTDASNHKFSSHVTPAMSGMLFGVGLYLFLVGRAMLDDISTTVQLPMVHQIPRGNRMR
jgi:hypothetical protein